MSTTRAVIYLRISLDKGGDGLAVERQRAACEAIVSAKGWHLVKTYTDQSKSAFKASVRRDEYEQMRADYAADRFDAIVCWDLDRLTRQPRQLEDWVEAAEAQGLALVTANGEADLTTDGGRMYARIKASVARNEIERKSERQLSKNAQSVDKGMPVPGKRRYGFLGADADTGRKVNTREHQGEAENVRALFADYLDGASIVSLAKRMGWRTLRVREALSNPAYAGWVVRRGERFEAHESVARIIEREEFERVQAKLADNSRQTRPGGQVKHWASGIVRCGVCGGPMQYRNAYLCLDDLSHPCIKGELLETRIRTEIVRALMLPGIAIESDTAGAELRAVERRTAALRAKKADWLRRLDDDEYGLTDEDVRPHVSVINRELAQLEVRLQELTTQSTAATMLAGLKLDIIDSVTHRADIGKAADVANQLGERFDSLDIDRKRELIRGMVEVRVFKGRSSERVEISHATRAGQALNEGQEEALSAA